MPDVNGPIYNKSPYPLDGYSLNPEGLPWASVQLAHDGTPAGYRGIAKMRYVLVGGVMKVYWYVDGAAFSNLQPFVTGGTGNNTIGQTFTTNIPFLGIPSGTVITEDMLCSAIIIRLLRTTYYPQITDPTFEITHNAGPLRIVGESAFDVALTLIYNRGLIDRSQWSGTNEVSGGDAIEYTFIKADNSNYDDQPQVSNVLVVHSYTVLKGLNKFKGKVKYGIGPQPTDSSNITFGTPYPAGTSSVVEKSFEGVFQILATTSDITVATPQPAVSMLAPTDTFLTLVAESGGQKQAIYIPIAFAHPLSGIYYFDPFLGDYDMSANKIGDFTPSVVALTSTTFNKFLYHGADRGSLPVKLTF